MSGTPGSESATNNKPTTKTASNKRSTTSDPSPVTIGTRSMRESAKTRANSPMRAGSRLLPMKPMQVA
jgi:hypothetical protein